MKRRIVTVVCLCLMLITAVACFGSKAASPPYAVPTATQEPTSTLTPTPTLTREPTPTLEPTPTSTLTPPPKPVNQRPTFDVQDFVRGTYYFHGLPYEEASKYDSSDIPILLEMLQDPQEIMFWATIVGTLGAIGDEQAVDPLISFLEENVSGTLSREHYNAKTAVLMSLGYPINKNGSQKALTYLKDSLDAQLWDQRALMWESPYASSTTQRNEQLVSLAIIGLALSGHPEAREALLAFQQGIGCDSRFNSLITEALDAHEIIAREGLAAYYQK